MHISFMFREGNGKSVKKTQGEPLYVYTDFFKKLEYQS